MNPLSHQDYEYDLSSPRANIVPKPAFVIRSSAAFPPTPMRDIILSNSSTPNPLPGPLRVRNWRPGDRFWPAHTKSPKKIKELLQERHVAQPERRLWPVVVSGEEIVWMRGFPVASQVSGEAGARSRF